MAKQVATQGDFESLDKSQVHALADQLLGGEPDAVERAVEFVCAESINQWHGRGRAMMCRRMKHLALSRDQGARLVAAVLERLSSGRFSEQFRDQLRLAIHLDPAGTFLAARKAAKSPKPHIRRFAEWVLSHEEAANDA